MVEGRGEAASAAAASLAVDCASNLAAVHLETGDYLAARDSAKAALTRKAQHPKALYRLARAQLALHELDDCAASLRSLQAMDPSNLDAKRLAAQLRKAREEYQAKSKRMGAGFLAGTHRPDSVEPKKVQDDEYDDELTWAEWIPWRVISFAACCFAFLLVALKLSPKRYVRFVLIGAVLLFPIVLSILTAAGPEGWKKEGERLYGKVDTGAKED